MKGKYVKYFSLLLTLTQAVYLSAQSVVINEVMYSNKDVLFDEDNNTPDWIELYNTTDKPLNLKNYKLTDDITKESYWVFPDYTLAAHDFLIVFASAKNRIDNNQFHTDFKLGLMEEEVFLLNPNNEIASYYPIRCVPENLSIGYITDGNGELQVQNPSPGKTNTGASIIPVNYLKDTLVINKNGGFYEKEFDLTILNEHSENEIRYTLDGSFPDLESKKYTAPITIKDRTPEENIYSNIETSDAWKKPGNNIFKITALRALVYSNGCPASNEIDVSYFVSPDIKNKYKIPIVSLITNPDNLFDKNEGIYVKGKNNNYTQHGGKWEREAHMEYFDSTGNKIIDQTIGIRIHGKSSRELPQKTLRLYARDKYGKSSFDYPFFKDKPQLKSFNSLLLRPPHDWSGNLFVDELCTELVKNMDIDYQAWRIVIVFINGEYWGIHSLKELQDIDYIKNNYNTETNDYDIISYEPFSGPTIAEGSMDYYNELIIFLSSHDLSDEENYEQACKMVDVNNLTDHYIAQFYFANVDFPDNNSKYWKEKDNDAKWRLFFFDSDASMMRVNYDPITEYGTQYTRFQRYKDWATIILQSFLANEKFRKEFVLKFYSHLNSAFKPDVVITKIDELEKLYEPLVPEQAYRWNNPVDAVKWKERVDVLRLFALQRPISLNEQLKDNFQNPFLVFPNPTNRGFEISNPFDNELDIRVQIFSTGAQAIYDNSLSIMPQSNAYIDPGLSNGFYLVKITEGNFSFISKLVKL